MVVHIVNCTAIAALQLQITRGMHGEDHYVYSSDCSYRVHVTSNKSRAVPSGKFKTTAMACCWYWQQQHWRIVYLSLISQMTRVSISHLQFRLLAQFLIHRPLSLECTLQQRTSTAHTCWTSHPFAITSCNWMAKWSPACYCGVYSRSLDSLLQLSNQSSVHLTGYHLQWKPSHNTLYGRVYSCPHTARITVACTCQLVYTYVVEKFCHCKLILQLLLLLLQKHIMYVPALLPVFTYPRRACTARVTLCACLPAIK